jgi:lipopolysaccharide export system permease protein
VDAETFVGMRYYDTTTKSANNFFLSKVRNNKMYYNLRAESIRWDTAKKNWRLENIIERNLDGLNEKARKIPSMNMNLNVKPNEMRRDDYLKDKLTTPELKEFIKMEEIGAPRVLIPIRRSGFIGMQLLSPLSL